MKVLVLGYSVTAENPGFVELASKHPDFTDYEWHKMGLGGFMPSGGVHLFSSEIDRVKPDIIILEQSTPAYRLFHPNKQEYPKWVLAILRKAQEHSARVSILDLPRSDVDFSDDWMVDIHKDLAEQNGLGHVIVPLDLAELRDTVHPTENGKKRYADYLIKAVVAAGQINMPKERFADVDEYAVVSLVDALNVTDGVSHYDRGGFESAMIDLPVGKKIRLKLDPPADLTGAVYLIGPKTGNVDITLNAEKQIARMYDPYAYYNRAESLGFYSHHSGNKAACSFIEFAQLPEIPDTELLKGEKDFSERLGGVSHLLVRGSSKIKVEEVSEMYSPKTNYLETAFARGFIMFENASGFSGTLRSSDVNDYIKGWTKTFFGPAELWYDARLNYTTQRDNNYGVGVMGLCLNPFDGANDNQKIADKLYAALKESEVAFLDYVDQLSGSFVILYRTGARIKILQDCAATKAVYYTKDAQFGTIVTSHANLAARPLALPEDPRAAEVYNNEAYRKDPSRYLPGMITSFKNIYALTANTALDFQSGKPNRFFPREDLKPQKLGKRLIQNVSKIMRQQAKLLAERGRPLMIATTAGRDSRVSLSSLAQYENSRFFSFHISQSGHLSEDVEIAQRLVSRIGKKLEVYDLPNYNAPSFRPVFTMTSPRGIWIAAAQCYIDEFPQDAIHVRSTVSEIGRMFYGRRVAKTVTAEGLARTFTVTDFGLDPLVIDTMQEFIDRTQFSEKNFYNYDIHDMFYWEHRNSKWQNILCLEAEMASDVFIPFNNRRLMMLFLGLPETERKAASLHVAITKEMCPEIADVPYIS